MSKNLTRKGLAFGAVVALGTTLFAGAPAQAASVLFAPSTGTGNTLVAGETFSLTASLSSDLPAANASQLKFKVANTTGVAATVTINSKTLLAPAASAAHGAGASVVSLDASVGGETAASALGASTTSAVYGIGSDVAAATSAIVATASNAANPTSIQIASAAATTASYTVTAFLDANNNAVIDNGEYSAAQTVNFVKIADSGVTVNYTKPTLSDANNVATISFAADVNVAQLTATKYALAFGSYGGSGKVAGSAATVFTAGSIAGNAVTYDSTNKVLKLGAAAAAAPAFTAAQTRSAQAIYNNAGVSTTASNALVGTEALQAVGAVEANSVSALAPVISDNAILDSGTSFKIRSGVTSTTLVATVKKDTSSTDATQIAVGAGATVKVTVSGLNLATASGATAADTITVNGVAVTSATVSTYSTTATTDASGKVSIPVVTSAGTAADAITVTITATNAASVTASATVTWSAATLSAVVDTIVGSNTPVHTAVKGGSYSAQYALTDSYNALVKTAGTYRLVFTAPGAGTSPTSQTIYADFVDGIATVSLTDNSTAAGTNAATYTVQKKTDGLWAQSADPNDRTVNVPFTVTATAPVAAAVSASEATSNTALELASTFATVDQRTAYNSAVAPSGFTALSINTITGQVTDAQGVGIAGAKVTVSATGVQFKAGTVYSVGTITVVANSAGTYTVDAYSHTAGKVTYKVTSGAATKTVDKTFANAAETTGTAISFVASKLVKSGRTLAVTVKLVDKFGNPVNGGATATGGSQIALSYEGPGFVVSDLSSVASLGTDGAYTVRVLLGADEAGLGTVTLKYDPSGDDLTSTDVISSSTDVLVGVSASVSAGKKLATAVVKNATGLSVKVVSGTKSVTKVATSDSFKVSLTKLSAGKNTVKVYVNDVLVSSKSVVVKK